VNAAQPGLPHEACDGSRPEAGRGQLLGGHQTVLAGGERQDGPVAGGEHFPTR
jgi:hypothetical protein